MATPYATAHFRTIASTQDEARARFDGDPVLVTADRQTAGRGRSGRPWISAPRALAASLAFRPPWPVAAWPRLTLVAGLAAVESLPKEVGLEWPNDIVVGDLKVGGVLSEADDEAVVTGLGVNLWWPDPPPGMGALFEADPGPRAAAEIAAAWADGVLVRSAAEPSDWGRAEYRRVCLTIGAVVSWSPEGRGRVVDVGEDGALVVETAQGPERLRSGEVEGVRSTTLPDGFEEVSE